MGERTGIVTMGGKPVTLTGHEVKVGDKAPDFLVINNDMQPITLAEFKGKVLVLSAVPSLDTSVCDAETRRFNVEATRLGSRVQIVTISMDLPFTQKRWCGQAGINRVITASDHRDASFGQAYGVLIKEVRLLARVVFVIDMAGIVRHIHVVNEVGKEPDYDIILSVVEKLLNG